MVAKTPDFSGIRTAFLESREVERIEKLAKQEAKRLAKLVTLAQIADLSGRINNVVGLVIRLVKQLGHEYRGMRQEVQDTKKALAEIQEELERLQQSQKSH